MTSQRYELVKSEISGKWVCTDKENLIVCIFEAHKFNDTQKVTTLLNFDPNKFMKLATYLREMGDWLGENHNEKIF